MSVAFTFQGGKRSHEAIAATAGNVIKNLSPGAGKRWLVLSGSIAIVTDVNAGNRWLVISKTDGTNVVEVIAHTAAQPASKTNHIDFGEGILGSGTSSMVLGDLADDAQFYFGIRPILIEGSDQLRFTVSGGLAGDSYSGYVTVLEMDV